MGAESWYAVVTRSRFEKVVASELQRKGIESYLPLIEETHAWKDRRKQVSVPLFPGYVFVRVPDCPQQQRTVLRTVGATVFLGFGDRIAPIPDSEINAIRVLIESDLTFNKYGMLQVGQWVRVRRGTLRGIEGFFERISKRGRLILCVQMLARAVAVEIDCSDVEPVRAPYQTTNQIA